MNKGRVVTLIAAFVLLLPAVAFTGDTQTVVAVVSGMHCEGCAFGIESMLKRTEGVVSANVSYESREASVEFDSAKASPEKIVAVIEKMGYKATIKK